VSFLFLLFLLLFCVFRLCSINNNKCNAVSQKGQTALFLAATRGYTEFVQELLDAGAKPDLPLQIQRRNFSPLMAACTKGHSDVALKLLEGDADPDLYDQEGSSTLLLAVGAKGDVVTIRNLLMFGANVGARDRHETTPLMVAAHQGKLDICQLLLRYHANPNSVDAEQSSVLSYAASSGHATIVHLLLRVGADMNAQDRDGWTPLVDAVRRDRFDAAKTLLHSGANIRIPLPNGTVTNAMDFVVSDQMKQLLQASERPGFQSRPPSALLIDPLREVMFRRIPDHLRHYFTLPIDDSTDRVSAQPPPTLPNPSLSATSSPSLSSTSSSSSVTLSSQIPPATSTVASPDDPADDNKRHRDSFAPLSMFSIARSNPQLAQVENVRPSRPNSKRAESLQSQLQTMGFDDTIVSRAVAVHPDSFEAALEWILAHPNSISKSACIPHTEIETKTQDKHAGPDTAPSSSSYSAAGIAVAAGASAGASIAMVAGAGLHHIGSNAIRLAPLFSGIYIVIQSILRQATHAYYNKDNCHFLARRCEVLGSILKDVEQHLLAHPQEFTTDREKLLCAVLEEFQAALEIVTQYTDRSWINRVVFATSIKEQFEATDRRLTGLVGDLSMGLTGRVLSELSSRLPYVQQSIDELKAQVKQVHSMVSDIRGQQLSRSPATRTDHLSELDPQEVKQILRGCTRESIVGSGSSSIVYHTTFRGMKVAVKDFSGRLHSPDAAADFRSECAILRSVRCSRVCTYVASYCEPPTAILVTEFCENGTLYDLLQNDRRDQQILPASESEPDVKHSSEAPKRRFLSRLFRRSSKSVPGPGPGLGLVDDANHSSDNPLATTAKHQVSDCDMSQHRDKLNGVVVDKSSSQTETFKLTLHDRLRVATQIAQGLVFLHKSRPRIIHRDLTSRNILLDTNFDVKIGDFGLSRTMYHTNLHTKVAGSPQYLSPEALLDNSITARSDVYSFGVLLIELFSGELPFAGLQLAQIAVKVAVKREKMSVPKTIPKPIRKIVKKCILYNATDRLSSSEVLEQLQQISL
jgi:serine/threonine protein kinase/ankyrin repeat protein